jgi:hypothetical protein
MKKELIEKAVPEALEKTLAPFMEDPSRFGAFPRYNEDGYRVPTPAVELVNDWIRRKPGAIEKVDAILASGELTMENVTARAFVREIDNIQRFDQLMANAEARRNGNLHEVEYHRAALAQRLRKATQDAIDAEFELVAPKAIAQKKHRKRS